MYSLFPSYMTECVASLAWIYHCSLHEMPAISTWWCGVETNFVILLPFWIFWTDWRSNLVLYWYWSVGWLVHASLILNWFSLRSEFRIDASNNYEIWMVICIWLVWSYENQTSQKMVNRSSLFLLELYDRRVGMYFVLFWYKFSNLNLTQLYWHVGP